jgi:hypothetical protein
MLVADRLGSSLAEAESTARIETNALPASAVPTCQICSPEILINSQIAYLANP